MRYVGGSLPQGPAASPILFMLFMAPLYQSMHSLRGYMDDGALLIASGSPDANATAVGAVF